MSKCYFNVLMLEQTQTQSEINIHSLTYQELAQPQLLKNFHLHLWDSAKIKFHISKLSNIGINGASYYFQNSCILFTLMWSLVNSLGVLHSNKFICSNFLSFIGSLLDSWLNHSLLPPEARNRDCSNVARTEQPATRAPYNSNCYFTWQFLKLLFVNNSQNQLRYCSITNNTFDTNKKN